MHQAMVDGAEDFVPPAWSCSTGHDDSPSAKKNEEEGIFSRRLQDDEHGHYHDHGHANQDKANDHDHHYHDHDHHDDDHHDDINLDKIKSSLRGSNLRLGKRRKLQGNQGYSYQVDVYLEIDFKLCAQNGETCSNGVVESKTMNYLNLLFAGANSVYEVRL